MAQIETYIRNKEEQKRSEEIHDKLRDDLLKRQLSNNENYDKTIISLSSAGLALSLTAIKFVIPLNEAEYLWIIKLSWVLFLLTIICSLSAYLVGNRAINKQLSIAQDYYIKGLISAQTAKNKFTKINSYFNNATGAFFIGAISCVIIFVILNLNGEKIMTKENSNTPKNPQRVYVTDSADIPTMQLAPGKEVTITKSADIPSMQMAPGSNPNSDSSSSSESTSSNESDK